MTTTLQLWHDPDSQLDTPSAEGYVEIRRWNFPAGLIRVQVTLHNPHPSHRLSLRRVLDQVPDDLTLLHHPSKGDNYGWLRDQAHLEGFRAYVMEKAAHLPGVRVVELPLGRFETIRQPYLMSTAFVYGEAWAWMTSSFHPRTDLALVVEAHPSIQHEDVELVTENMIQQIFFGPLWKMQPSALTMRIRRLESNGVPIGSAQVSPIAAFGTQAPSRILRTALKQAGGMLIQPLPSGEFTVLETNSGNTDLSMPRVTPIPVVLSDVPADFRPPINPKRLTSAVIVKAEHHPFYRESQYFGEAIIRFDPILDSDVVIFDDALPAGTLSAETHDDYVRAVFQGILETASTGMVGFRATVLDAQERELDSNAMAFRSVGRDAARLVLDTATNEP